MPKPAAQRRRRNKSPDGPTVTAPGAALVEQPAPSEEWHPVALAWYRSLAESGQAVFYQPADWQTAWLLSESISRELSPQPVVADGKVVMVSMPPKAASLAAWRATMAALLVTEGDRRRVRLELERPAPAGAGGGGDGGAPLAWLDAARRGRAG